MQIFCWSPARWVLGLYCFVLSRRLKRFTDLEKGVGGAVAVLSTQADELKQSLGSVREASDQSGATLKDLTERAGIRGATA